MTKTTNYQLNQWEPTDPIRREDFNADNAAIDAALTAVPKIVTGTYTGDGTADRTIELGFTPKAVFVCNGRGATCYNGPTGALLICGGLVLPDSPIVYSTTTALAIVDGGFRINYYNGTSFYSSTNSNGMTYHYAALC